MAQTIMFIGAHHDDNELMAGTIARHRAAGWRVVSVVMTHGRWTRQGLSADNIKIRNNESLAAAKLLDMEAVFLGLNEGGLRATEEACKAVVETIRKHQPHVIVTHPPRDYHSDHMETCRAVEDAVYRAGNNAYDADGKPWGNTMLYYCDAWAMPFEPDVYVDVADHLDIKRDALACHKSQLPGGVPSPGDMIEIELVRARQRGVECSSGYAEAFRLAPRPGRVRMAELLV